MAYSLSWFEICHITLHNELLPRSPYFKAQNKPSVCHEYIFSSWVLILPYWKTWATKSISANNAWVKTAQFFSQVISYTHCTLFLHIKCFLTIYDIRAKTNLFYGSNWSIKLKLKSEGLQWLSVWKEKQTKRYLKISANPYNAHLWWSKRSKELLLVT